MQEKYYYVVYTSGIKAPNFPFADFNGNTWIAAVVAYLLIFFISPNSLIIGIRHYRLIGLRLRRLMSAKFWLEDILPIAGGLELLQWVRHTYHFFHVWCMLETKMQPVWHNLIILIGINSFRCLLLVTLHIPNSTLFGQAKPLLYDYTGIVFKCEGILHTQAR